MLWSFQARESRQGLCVCVFVFAFVFGCVCVFRGGCHAGILTCFRLLKPVQVGAVRACVCASVCVCVHVCVCGFARQHWCAWKLYKTPEVIFAEGWRVFVCVCGCLCLRCGGNTGKL